MARALNDHPRNVPDNILQMLPKNGGVDHGHLRARLRLAEGERVEQAADGRAGSPEGGACRTMPRRVKAGVDKWTAANPAPAATIADVADHVDHIRKIAGIDHIGVGGDFDGITQTVKDLDNVSTYPRADGGADEARLQRRGPAEDPRAEHPARDARGREGLEAPPGGTRAVGRGVASHGLVLR